MFFRTLCFSRAEQWLGLSLRNSQLPVVLFILAISILIAGCQPEGGSDNGNPASGGANPAKQERNQGVSDGTAARLIRVSDGDTLLAEVSGKEVKVRLHGVDAPELDQPYGLPARKCLKSLLKERSFRIRTEYEDPYGRSVATLISSTGEDLNAELVRRGCAWAFLRYSEKYVTQESQARDAKSGLWSGKEPMPPWTWRRRSPVKTDR